MFLMIIPSNYSKCLDAKKKNQTFIYIIDILIFIRRNINIMYTEKNSIGSEGEYIITTAQKGCTSWV